MQNSKYYEGVWFVYDGECPICSFAARSLRIRSAVGDLNLIDARSEKEHPLYKEIVEQGLDLDEGMVLRYSNVNYHGQDALNMMALLGSNQGWFNRFNALLFRNKLLSKMLYPVMRAGRNFLLWTLGVTKIDNLEGMRPQTPLFSDILGDKWQQLPPALRDHYLVRQNSNDEVTVAGKLDVKVKPWVGLMAGLSGMLVPYSGTDIPVTVKFNCAPPGNALRFTRTFYFPGKKPIQFVSRMVSVGNNELIEFMNFGFGWRFHLDWKEERLILSHRGYVWRIFGLTIPMPFSLFLGKGFAEEKAIAEKQFSMWTHTTHPIFGKPFGYKGSFEVTGIRCDPS